MTKDTQKEAGEISVFTIATMLLRARWRVVRWMLIGAFLAGLAVFDKPVLYVASASFVPQGTDGGRSGLAGLAGQFGVSLPGGSQSLSPEFYSDLLESRVLLAPITRDTLVVPELGGKRHAFTDLFKIKETDPARREEQGVRALQAMVSVSVIRTTGVVGLAVSSPWRSVSLAIATALVDGVNDYNEQTRQVQAAAERKFVESRLAVAGSDLRAAEDRFEQFLRANRDLGGSAELAMQRDRLQRDLNFRQQVFTTLTQAYEDARIREVRDTPMITTFEPPSVPTYPAGRGRVKSVIVGFLIGGFIGIVLVFVKAAMARRREDGDPEVEDLFGVLAQIKDEVRRPLRRVRGRAGA